MSVPQERKEAIRKHLTRLDHARGLLLFLFVLTVLNLLTGGLEDFPIIFYLFFFSELIFIFFSFYAGFWGGFLVALASSSIFLACFYLGKRYNIFLVIGFVLFLLDFLFLLGIMLWQIGESIISWFDFLLNMRLLSAIVATYFFVQGMISLAWLKNIPADEVDAIRQENEQKQVLKMDTETMLAAVRKFNEEQGEVAERPKAILHVMVSPPGAGAIMTLQEGALHFYIFGRALFIQTVESRMIIQKTIIPFEEIFTIKRTFLFRRLKIYDRRNGLGPSVVSIVRSPSVRESRKETLPLFWEQLKQLQEKHGWK